MSESTHVKMPHCWKSHVMAHFISVHSCSSITSEISDENLVSDCDSYNAGATCSLSCLNNYELDGDDIVVCEDDSRTEQIDYLWNDMNNTACIGTIKHNNW